MGVVDEANLQSEGQGYTCIEGALPTVKHVSNKGNVTHFSKAIKTGSIAKCQAVAKWSNTLRSAAAPLQVKTGAAGMGRTTAVFKGLGTRLGIAGAVVDGVYNIHGDLNKKEYSQVQKGKAVVIHGGAMVLSGAAVVGCSMLAGTAAVVAAGPILAALFVIGVGIMASTVINYTADYLIDTKVEGKSR